MARSNSEQRPKWLRNPILKFFASLKLAVVLLAVLIVASIIGTLYESTFDAKVARAYVYGAPWFNLWLLLLATNLAVSAFSRWPWRQQHVAFLVTHLGIITLLTGAMIGRIWGVEGTMTLFKGEPPQSRLLINERQLRVHDTDGIVKGYRAEFVNRPPRPERPRNLGTLAGGAQLSIVDYAPAVEAKLEPKPAESGGAPALHFEIRTAMMNQRLESWLLANHPEHSVFNMGLATIELRAGRAPEIPAGTDSAETKPSSPEAAPENASAGETAIEESIFAFAKAPEQQMNRALKGGSTGAKVRLSAPEGPSKGQVTITLGGTETTMDVAENLGRERAMEGTPYRVLINNYWPDFRIHEGKFDSVTDQPNNPAVLITLRGRGVPLASDSSPGTHVGTLPAQSGSGAEATNPSAHGNEPHNHLTVYVAEDGTMTYHLESRRQPARTGTLALNAPLETGWADWQITVDRIMPRATHWMEFKPPEKESSADLPDGIRVRVEQDGKVVEQWLASGWQVLVPARPREIQLAYGWRTEPLPIGVELLNFEVARNEGSDSPASFKSTVRVSTPEGASGVGSCWMNHPFNFPGRWWNTWSGLTYKMSQASWNPENLNQSTVQILRDPGWSLKWVGSLLVSSGIFLLFYVKRFRRPSVRGMSVPLEKPAANKEVQRPEPIGV